MAQDVLEGGEAEQRMDDPTVSHIDLRGLDQPLADVAMPWRQTAHEQQIDQQVEVACDGLAIDA